MVNSKNCFERLTTCCGSTKIKSTNVQKTLKLCTRWSAGRHLLVLGKKENCSLPPLLSRRGYFSLWQPLLPLSYLTLTRLWHHPLRGCCGDHHGDTPTQKLLWPSFVSSVRAGAFRSQHTNLIVSGRVALQPATTQRLKQRRLCGGTLSTSYISLVTKQNQRAFSRCST